MNKPDFCKCGKVAVVGLGNPPEMLCLTCFNSQLDAKLAEFKDFLSRSPFNPQYKGDENANQATN